MTTTTAPTTNGQPVSLLELGAGKVAGLVARRKDRGDRPRRGVVSAVGELLGTLAALACFVIASFAVGFVVGWVVAGVALLLLDFKITVIRRNRAATRQQRR